MEPNIKKPLANIDIEFELLGEMTMHDGRCIPTVASILKPDDFYRYEHQLIYKAILALHEKGLPVTVPTISDYLHDNNEIEKVGYAMLMDLLAVAFTDADAESYAAIIKTHALKRQQKVQLKKSINDLESTNAVAFNTDKFAAEQIAFFENLAKDASPIKPVSISEYFSGGDNSPFMKTVKESQAFTHRKSSFENLDENQVWPPGLGVLGAVPAAGKTSLTWQLLCQFAQNKENCIFCTYEMSLLQLFAKSIARRYFIQARENELSPVSSTAIRLHGKKYLENEISKMTDKELKFFEKELAKDPDLRDKEVQKMLDSSDLLIEIIDEDFSQFNLSVLDCRGKNIDELLLMLRIYCKDNKAPIIAIDYLQLIPPPTDKNFTDMQAINYVVSRLKDFSNRYNALILLVSSFNRASYKDPASLSASRGSSGIEYSADFVWSLSLVNPLTVTGEGGKLTKITDANLLKRQTPRKIQLDCLKNRHGMDYTCYFNYYAANDYFEPCENPNDEVDDQNEVAAESQPTDNTASQTDDEVL